MSYEWYIILKIVRQNIAEYVEIQWSRQPESLNSIGYRLCVLASGSWMMDRFSCLTAIKVSCLHLGQYSGKFSRTVSSRIFNRVLLPQKGHKIHSIFMLSSSVLGFLFFLPDGKLAVFLRLFLLTALDFPFQLTLLMLEFQRLLCLCANPLSSD